MTAVIFFALTVLCVPALPDGAEIPRWALMAVTTGILIFRVELTSSYLIVVAYVAGMALLGPSGYDALLLFVHFLILSVLFISRLDLRQVAIGGALGMAVNSGFMLAQHYGFTYVPMLSPLPGLFYNRNIGAEAAGVILALTVAYRLWWLVPGVLPVLMFGSRAPIIALGTAAALAVGRRSPFLGFMTFMGGILFVVSWMHDYGGLTDLVQRFGVWQDMLPGMRPWGHGLGSFIAEFPLYQRHTTALQLRFENAHNDFMQLCFELGLMAVLAAAVVLAQLWGTVRSPAWYALVVFLVEGCFGVPLYEPVTACFAAVCAGSLFAEHVVLFDLLAAWGPRVWAWACDPRQEPFPLGKPALSRDQVLQIGAGLRRHNLRRRDGYPVDRGGVAA
jgi:hypothetical protein